MKYMHSICTKCCYLNLWCSLCDVRLLFAVPSTSITQWPPLVSPGEPASRRVGDVTTGLPAVDEGVSIVQVLSVFSDNVHHQLKLLKEYVGH